MRHLLVALVAALVVGVLLLLLWPRPATGPANAPPVPAAVGEAAVGSPGSASAGPSTAAGGPVERSASAPVRIDAVERARLLAEIGQRLAAARDRVAASLPATSPGTPGAAPGSSDPPLSARYIKEQVREIIPLVKECYEQALEQQPGLDATITVRFTIEGDPELGGVISRSELAGQDGAAPPGSLAECVVETMYALKLKAPEGGGVVNVTYPFKFSSSPD